MKLSCLTILMIHALICKPSAQVQSLMERLPDFSYAGYHKAAELPADAHALGYKVYNVKDYGAVGDGKTNDRQALLRCCEAMLKERSTTGIKETAIEIHVGTSTICPEVNAILYFPEGEYLLLEESDFKDGVARPIRFHLSNFIIKGAGRDKTRLIMAAPGCPGPMDYGGKNGKQLWDGTPLFDICGWVTGTVSKNAVAIATGSCLANGRDLHVSDASQFHAGDWIMVECNIKDKDYVLKETGWTESVYENFVGEIKKYGGPEHFRARMGYLIAKEGVHVQEFHQIESIDGDCLHLCECMQHSVDSGYEFRIHAFHPIHESGIEDMTFVGNAPENYYHHGGYYGTKADDMLPKEQWWIYDSGYIAVTFYRGVDCWARRMGFDSMIEGVTFCQSANCSAYDLEFFGHPGHSTARSYSATNIFIGAVWDRTKDSLGSGYCHATGVNKRASGTVIWRSHWGPGSSFESHCDQPRNTLFDCCDGGLYAQLRFGGSFNRFPHHMKGLVMWNFNCTYSPYETIRWWGDANVINPVFVGLHGAAPEFPTGGMEAAADISRGKAVKPESLYEYQLKKRFGKLPSWIKELKKIAVKE